MGGGITQAVGAIIRNKGKGWWTRRWGLPASSGNQSVWCWRWSVCSLLAVCWVILPWDFVFGPEGSSGGSCAALCGSEGGGIDAAVSGGALKIAVELKITPHSWTRAHLIPLLIAVGGAGGIARERVAAWLAGWIRSILLFRDEKSNQHFSVFTVHISPSLTCHQIVSQWHTVWRLLIPTHLGAFVGRRVAALLWRLQTRNHCLGNHSFCKKQRHTSIEVCRQMIDNNSLVLFGAIANTETRVRKSSYPHWFCPPVCLASLPHQFGTIQH